MEQKLYYRISEVADMLGEPQSTLRFWEKEFEEFLSVDKTGGSQRKYKAENIETLRAIQYLLREANFKIDGAKEQLRQDRRRLLNRIDLTEKLENIRQELLAIRREIKATEEE